MNNPPAPPTHLQQMPDWLKNWRQRDHPEAAVEPAAISPVDRRPIDRQRAAIAAGHPEWAELPATKAEAQAAGVTQYFTGVPCPKGHVNTRRASNWNCSECVRGRTREWFAKPENRKYQSEYMRQRYQTDPEVRERMREYMRQRWANDPEFREHHREYRRKRYANDPEFRERKREYQRKRRANDPEFRERQREYYRKRRASVNTPVVE